VSTARWRACPAHTLVVGGPQKKKPTRVPAKPGWPKLFHHPGTIAARSMASTKVVIVFDPKGDADLLKRMYVGRPQRAGTRRGVSIAFHLGWPDIFRALQRGGPAFGRISEVATRIAGQLSAKATAQAFPRNLPGVS